MRIAHLYRMTVASTWYDKPSRCAREYEMHFKVSRPGKLRTVRYRLARRGTEYFQRLVYRRFRKWIPKRKIRIGFEREELATEVQQNIAIEVRSMEYRGRQRRAFPWPPREVSYAKKRRHLRNGRR